MALSKPAAADLKLSGKDLAKVVESLTTVGSTWFHIGLQLGMSDERLRRIRDKKLDDPLLEMLMEWLNGCDPVPTKGSLVKALRSRSVGENRLAGEIECSTLGQESATVGKSKLADGSEGSTVGEETPTEGSYYSCAMEATSPSSTSSDGSEPNSKTHEAIDSSAVTKTPCSKGAFPRLRTDLSDHDRNALEGRLLHESYEMTDLFGELVTNMQSSLEDRAPIEKLTSYLLDFNFITQRMDAASKLFCESQAELKAAETINAVFDVLRPYYSFFNYELIGKVIGKLGTDDDKARLEAYETRFHEFCKRKVYECPAGTFGLTEDKHKNEMHLVVKMKGDFKGFTLEAENLFHRKLCKILNVEGHALRFIDASEGCIRLVFSFPSSLEELVFPLSDKQKESLRGEGVTQLKIDDFDYLVEIHTSIATPRTHKEHLVTADKGKTGLPQEANSADLYQREPKMSFFDQPVTPYTIPQDTYETIAWILTDESGRSWKDLAGAIGATQEHVTLLNQDREGCKGRLFLEVWERSGRSSVRKFVFALLKTDMGKCLDELVRGYGITEYQLNSLISEFEALNANGSAGWQMLFPRLKLRDLPILETTKSRRPPCTSGAGSHASHDLDELSCGEEYIKAELQQGCNDTVVGSPRTEVDTVFISYVPETGFKKKFKQKSKISALVHMLQKQGYKVHYDKYCEQDIHKMGGLDLWKERCIMTSKHIIVICTSEYYLEDQKVLFPERNGTVSKMELECRLLRQIGFSPDQSRLISVFFAHDCNYRIPTWLSGRHFVLPNDDKNLLHCLAEVPLFVFPEVHKKVLLPEVIGNSNDPNVLNWDCST